MIKINLATKKRSSSAGAGTGTRIPGLMEKLNSVQLSAANLAGVPVKSILITTVLSVGLYFWFDIQKKEEIEKVVAQVAKETADQAKLRAQFEKTKGYQQKKDQLERDEKILRTKIDTIKKLTSDRDVPPRLLHEIADGIPKDVWISSLDFDDDKQFVVLRAKSYSETSANAFSSAANASSLLKDAHIKESSTDQDATGNKIISFTVEARRK